MVQLNVLSYNEDPPGREVEVVPYGSQGCKPKNPTDCPYRGEMACVSGSSDSLCGGCVGYGTSFALCSYDKDEQVN